MLVHLVLKMKRREYPKFTGQIMSHMRSDCFSCPQRFTCMTAGGLGKDKIRYAKQIRRIKDPINEAMKKGKELHEMYLSPYKELEDYGLFQFLEDLRKGKKITLSEVPICSRYYGLRGIIDKLTIQLVKKELNIEITELKSGYYKGYIYQLAAYGMILSDPRFEIIYEKKTVRGKSIITGVIPLPDRPLNKNIKINLQILSTGNVITKMWLENNAMSECSRGMMASAQKRMKLYRKFHKLGVSFAEDFDKTIKHKQWFFGKNRLLKKTKPRIFAEVRI